MDFPGGCDIDNCTFCAKIEKKNSSEKEKSLSRIILVVENLEDWRREQKEDPGIALVYKGKEMGERPLVWKLWPEMFVLEYTGLIGMPWF